MEICHETAATRDAWTVVMELTAMVRLRRLVCGREWIAKRYQGLDRLTRSPVMGNLIDPAESY